MKTPFEKIYVLSLITNKERQEFIKKQFADLGIEFEFIYGIDYVNIKFDQYMKEINWPICLQPSSPRAAIAKDFGCAMTHYQGVLYAYEQGYNNVLIFEDDICFIKNHKLIEDSLNNIPFNADFVTWDPRSSAIWDQPYYTNIINNSAQDQYFCEEALGRWIIGGMMYGIMNRKTMELYLNNQRNNGFMMSDHVKGIWNEPDINTKRYFSTKCLCTDFVNICTNFNPQYHWYVNMYYRANPEAYTIDMFYNPDKSFEAWGRYEPGSEESLKSLSNKIDTIRQHARQYLENANK